MNCRACGDACGLLGILGTRAWFRCRSCGLDSSDWIENVDIDTFPDWAEDRDGESEFAIFRRNEVNRLRGLRRRR